MQQHCTSCGFYCDSSTNSSNLGACSSIALAALAAEFMTAEAKLFAKMLAACGLHIQLLRCFVMHIVHRKMQVNRPADLTANSVAAIIHTRTDRQTDRHMHVHTQTDRPGQRAANLAHVLNAIGQAH